MSNISIHALTGSATLQVLSCIFHFHISIHALTGSATKYHCTTCSVKNISIHALTGSATSGVLKCLDFTGKFQSTHSRGVRLYALASSLNPLIISIHALTGSATPAHKILSYLFLDFNPRTHGECDCVPTIYGPQQCQISIHALTGSAT